jgi:glycosyltransferase involved in cell wall biosynthesis
MTEPIEIGLVAPLPPQVGGVASFAQWLLNHEAVLGCRYHTFDLRRPPDEEVGGRLRPAAAVRQGIQLARFLRWLRKAPLLVHYCVSLTATGLLRDLLFVALLRATGRRTIAHVHGPAGIARRSQPLLLRAVGGLSAARIAVVPLRDWTFLPNPLRLTPDGRGRRSLHESLRLLAVGPFGASKGSEILVEALAAARSEGVSATVRFVGRELRRDDERALRERVRALGLDGDVEFAGTLAPDRLPAEYREADVFCLPSRREGLPMALVEAMAFELPVVTTPVGAIPVLVEHDRTGLLVEPGNVAQLAEAIARLAKEDDLRSRLGKAAGKRVRELCSPDKVAREWNRLYSELAR